MLFGTIRDSGTFGDEFSKVSSTPPESSILSELEGDPSLNTMVHFLYFQGLRGNEARTLIIEDIELGNGGFFVRGKGRDEDKEWIRFHPRTVKTLKDYLKKENLGSTESRIAGSLGYSTPHALNDTTATSERWGWPLRFIVHSPRGGYGA